MSNSKKFSVQLLYSINNKVSIKNLEISNNTSIADFINQIPGNLQSKINISKKNFGVFGKIVQSNYILKEGDRVEIYEEALVEAIEFRKNKAKK